MSVVVNSARCSSRLTVSPAGIEGALEPLSLGAFTLANTQEMKRTPYRAEYKGSHALGSRSLRRTKLRP